MDGQTTQSIAVANPETGDVTEGQVEAIIKAGLQGLTWPAALVEPAAGGLDAAARRRRDRVV
jgi:hypothetical protein